MRRDTRKVDRAAGDASQRNAGTALAGCDNRKEERDSNMTIRCRVQRESAGTGHASRLPLLVQHLQRRHGHGAVQPSERHAEQLAPNLLLLVHGRFF